MSQKKITNRFSVKLFQFTTSEGMFNIKERTNLADNSISYVMMATIPVPLQLPNGQVAVMSKEEEYPLKAQSFSEVEQALETLIAEAEAHHAKSKIITPGQGGLHLVN